MKIEVVFTGQDCSDDKVIGKNAVVIDVLRATSVIVTALRNGASAVVPFAAVEDAVRYADAAGTRVILGGERNAEKIAGFDCGNSPLEYTRERVEGREVALTTTNGTRAIENARAADKLFVMCMLNADAVAKKIFFENKDAFVVCSGTDGKFSADDALCAGLFIDCICAMEQAGLDDAARFVRDFYRMIRAEKITVKDALADSLHLARLRAKGYEADIDYCLQSNVFDIAPVYGNGRITI